MQRRLLAEIPHQQKRVTQNIDDAVTVDVSVGVAADRLPEVSDQRERVVEYIDRAIKIQITGQGPDAADRCSYKLNQQLLEIRKLDRAVFDQVKRRRGTCRWAANVRSKQIDIGQVDEAVTQIVSIG